MFTITEVIKEYERTVTSTLPLTSSDDSLYFRVGNCKCINERNGEEAVKCYQET